MTLDSAIRATVQANGERPDADAGGPGAISIAELGRTSAMFRAVRCEGATARLAARLVPS